MFEVQCSVLAQPVRFDAHGSLSIAFFSRSSQLTRGGPDGPGGPGRDFNNKRNHPVTGPQFSLHDQFPPSGMNAVDLPAYVLLADPINTALKRLSLPTIGTKPSELF